MKKVSFIDKPTSGASAAAMDNWVKNRNKKFREPTKRFTIDVPIGLHMRMKTHCASNNLLMADVIRELLEQRFPEEIGQGPTS